MNPAHTKTSSNTQLSALILKNILSRLITPVIILFIFLYFFCLINFEINLYAISSLSLGCACLVLAFIIYAYARQRLHNIWAIFNLAVGVWGAGTYLVAITDNYNAAMSAWKLAHTGLLFISISFYHVVYIFCNLRKRNWLLFAYIQGIVFSLLVIATNLMIKELDYVFNSFYYEKANFVNTLAFCIWISIVVSAFVELSFVLRSTSGLRKTQASYLFYGMLIGFLGGVTTAAPSYGMPIYPVGHFTICVYAAISTYAIFKYQLMDIRIAVTRVGVFIAVYTLVLGIPFTLAFGLQEYFIKIAGDKWWIIPLIASTFLATVGPFVYFYIQKRAEERLFQEQHRYQTTLRQASVGMGRIKDINRLVNLIVHIVTRTVRLEHSMIYLNDESNKGFVLSALKSRVVRFNPLERIPYETELVIQLFKTRRPIVYEEIKEITQEQGDWKIARLEAELRSYDAALVVPSFIDEKLLAIIILGEKVTKQMYTNDDLTVFSILANQAALAIENALFFEDIQNTTEQLFKAEKMATIGTMADGLSHQINNRLHALGFIAGDVLDTIKLKKNVPMTPEIKEIMVDIEHALTRIQENVSQGGEIVRGLLKYTRKGEEGLTDVELDQLVSAALEMTQFKIKPGEMALIREYGADLPTFKANFAQMQEVFFNLIDNAYDAAMQRKSELKEEGFKPTIRINASAQNGKLNIELQDNGMGIKDDDKDKLFTPFFSTKLSSKKGTGLGLYVIQKLIEENHKGKVTYFSEYKKGTKVLMELPIEQI